jgi:uncharacterized membrane protein YfcA
MVDSVGPVWCRRRRPSGAILAAPAAVAVSTQANQVRATPRAGVSAHWRERAVDVRLGTLMLMGGLAGSTVGVGVFSLLKFFGVVDETIAVLYIVFLGVIGGLMAWESVGALGKTGGDPGRRTRLRAWMRGLPIKRRFPRSGLYISIRPPLGIGFFVGLLAAVLGVGGGFILAPAMVYLLGVPTRVMVGTSLFQIIFLTAYVTFLQATFNGTVDLVLPCADDRRRSAHGWAAAGRSQRGATLAFRALSSSRWRGFVYDLVEPGLAFRLEEV